MERPPLRLSPGLRTPPTRSRRRTPRWGQANEHGPGTTRSTSHKLILQSIVHSQRATSRRTTSWGSVCGGSDQMTAPPDQATAGWSRSQRRWILSVPTQDSDRGCSEWAVQQIGCTGGIAHIQACAAWARRGCFGSRGCSVLAMPLPRRDKSRPTAASAESDRPNPGADDRRDAGAHDVRSRVAL